MFFGAKACAVAAVGALVLMLVLGGLTEALIGAGALLGMGLIWALQGVGLHWHEEREERRLMEKQIILSDFGAPGSAGNDHGAAHDDSEEGSDA